MEWSIMDNLKMIRNKAMACTTGVMGEFTKDGGTGASNMDLAHISTQKRREPVLVCGNSVKEWLGLMKTKRGRLRQDS
jgi:hypothetical protein